MNFVGDFVDLKMGIPYETENSPEGLNNCVDTSQIS